MEASIRIVSGASLTKDGSCCDLAVCERMGNQTLHCLWTWNGGAPPHFLFIKDVEFVSRFGSKDVFGTNRDGDRHR
jgi:hypothetical protein